jgi:hypothetical protein
VTESCKKIETGYSRGDILEYRQAQAIAAGCVIDRMAANHGASGVSGRFAGHPNGNDYLTFSAKAPRHHPRTYAA